MAHHGCGTRPHGDISADHRQRLTASLLDRAGAAQCPERDLLLERVVLANLGVAQAIASRYRSRGVALEDLEQVAYLALVRATRRFDAAHHRDFLAYAVPSIRGEVRRYFRDHGWTVRPPRSLQELRVRILAEADRQRAQGVQPSDVSVAAALGVSVREVEECRATEGCFRPASLDQWVGDEAGTTVGDVLADPGTDARTAALEARLMLGPVVGRLKPRDLRLLRLRFAEELTQQEIADRFGITQTQVSRLLIRILRELRHALAETAVPVPTVPALDRTPGPRVPGVPSGQKQVLRTAPRPRSSLSGS